ncbi:hypothetical protein [Salipiger mucosus]|uniref:Uncharacterized protein n=1 Tax=Salipiger mucosus DSM 16094 TaxID=1123237 RepID=S9Q8P7_9RHOB|nr:hypothetical protein [Salipiger mucosus]EPX76392.1 hypothetical protein Salmuc_02894 [Salipiger mucosus DSM 16094]
MNTLTQISLSILSTLMPEGFAPVGQSPVSVDGRDAVLVRAERETGRNAGLGGEHVSTVEADGQLLGYVRMTSAMAQPAELPSEETARSVAMSFLETHAPDLRQHHRVHWVAPHEETVTMDGETHTLTGMKVKMRATTTDRLWFWVIVGPGDEVMVFERDIYWITMPGRRRTEQWLHDSWLAERSEVPELVRGDTY